MPDEVNMIKVLSPNGRIILQIDKDKKSLSLYENDDLIVTRMMSENTSHFCVTNYGDICFLKNEGDALSVCIYFRLNESSEYTLIINREKHIIVTEDAIKQNDKFYLIEINYRSYLVIVNRTSFELFDIYNKTHSVQENC